MNVLELTAALALLAQASSALPQGIALRRAPARIESVQLDLGTGALTRGPRAANRSAATVADFTNLDLGGFIGIESGNGFCEWFDAGIKGFRGNGSDLMSSILFPYCSWNLDPSLGGPGGSMKLGFYEGYQAGGGAPTTTVAAFSLTGLPATTTSCSFFACTRCYFLEVSFTPLIAFADGPIGYSWKFLGADSTGVLAGTFPFLACVGSCSGTVGTLPDRQGMDNLLDQYCPPGTLRSSFSFGTTSGSFTSIAMEIREASDLAATVLAYNASTTPNRDTLQASPAVLGRRFAAALVRDPVSPSGNFTLLVHTNRIAGNGVAAPPPVLGRLLVSGPRLGTLAGTHDGQLGTLQARIPAQLGLLGQHFAAQALVTGGGVALSSAIEGTVGTF